MATFDQLPPEQRAIIELVLQRGQSYSALADMLGMPTARVRQLAREALTDLSPRSAARVDADWRGQVADYLLGQQTGPESTATRGHLKRSESARLWALSLLDSLDNLYRDGHVPEIPEAEAEPTRERAPARRARRRESPLRPPRRTPRPARPLSADAETIVRRRRIAAGVGGATLLLFILLIWPIGLLTGDDDGGGGGSGNGQDGQQAEVQQLLLRAQPGEKGIGIAFLTERDGQPFLLVQGRGLQRTERGQAYEVWLYNSQKDAVSIGAQLTDRRGNFQGAGRLPADFEKFRFLDISRENVDQNAAHSGDSVLRGRLDDLQPSALGQAPQGGTTTPQGGGSSSPIPGG